MSIEKIKQLIKNEFNEISAAFFNSTLNIQYILGTNRIFGEGGSMFGASTVRYSETNFEYFYYYLKFLCIHIDIINLRLLDKDYNKFRVTSDLLSIDFIKQAQTSKPIPNNALFKELNFIANLFVFFHECGHVNQAIDPDKDSTDTKHFSEFNSDYYALSNILKYYYSLRKKHIVAYYIKALLFENEHSFIRCVIVVSLVILFMECLSSSNISETSTHPSIRKLTLIFFCE